MAIRSIDTIAFRVVGEQRDGSGHLLLLGDDGRYYEYGMERCEVMPIEPDDSWVIDAPSPDSMRRVLPDHEAEMR